MSPFEVTVLGVGDSFSELHHPTSLLLSYEGFHLAIDCPDMYRRVLYDARQKQSKVPPLTEIDHFLITHVHGDHMNGLEGVTFFKHFAQRRKVQLISSPELRDVLWEQRLVASMGQLWNGRSYQKKSWGDYFEHTALCWDGEVRVGPFTIRTHRTQHHVPTSALLITAGDQSLGVSSDTAFDPELIHFLCQADLVIHETNRGVGHTAYSALAALPEAQRGKLRLIHYPDDFDSSHSVIPVLTEGEFLVLG